MEQGPLPPHERTWRHPSELAAEERARAHANAAAPSTRVFALVTGSIGLLAIGVLILAVSPRPHDSPIAISATTTPIIAAIRPSPAATTNPSRSAATRSQADLAEFETPRALATPIGDGRVALVTIISSDARPGDRIDIRFSTGQMGGGQVIETGDRTVTVELDDPGSGYKIANERPKGHEMVTVMADPPLTVLFKDIGALDVHEGTAVINRSGALVGLCSQIDDGSLELIEVSGELVEATNAGR